MMSASAPAGKPTRNTGRVVVVCISAIKTGEVVKRVMSHSPHIGRQGGEPDGAERGAAAHRPLGWNHMLIGYHSGPLKTLQALQFIKHILAKEKILYIMKRRGAKMRSPALLYHGRRFHCSMVSSNFSAVSSAKSADNCWANSAL